MGAREEPSGFNGEDEIYNALRDGTASLAQMRFAAYLHSGAASAALQRLGESAPTLDLKRTGDDWERWRPWPFGQEAGVRILVVLSELLLEKWQEPACLEALAVGKKWIGGNRVRPQARLINAVSDAAVAAEDGKGKFPLEVALVSDDLLAAVLFEADAMQVSLVLASVGVPSGPLFNMVDGSAEAVLTHLPAKRIVAGLHTSVIPWALDRSLHRPIRAEELFSAASPRNTKRKKS